MNKFILHGETLGPKASLQVFQENTSRYEKKEKYSKNQLFTEIYYNEIYLHLISCPASVQFHTDFSFKSSTSAFVVLLHWPSVLTHINEISLSLCSETTCLRDEVPLDS